MNNPNRGKHNNTVPPTGAFQNIQDLVKGFFNPLNSSFPFPPGLEELINKSRMMDNPNYKTHKDHVPPQGTLQNFPDAAKGHFNPFNLSLPFPLSLQELINKSRMVAQGLQDNKTPLQKNGFPYKKIVKRHEDPMPTAGNVSCNLTDEILSAIFYNRHFKCTDNVDFRTEVLLVDRTTVNNPVSLSNHGLENFYYSVPGKNPASQSEETCAVLENEAFSTAAVGDINGDGHLDLVLVNIKIGQRFSPNLVIFGQKPILSTTVQTINLFSYLKRNTTNINVNSEVHESITAKSLKDVNLLPLSQQKWTAYMGKNGNGYYNSD